MADGVLDFGRFKEAKKQNVTHAKESTLMGRVLPKVYRVTGRLVSDPTMRASGFTLTQTGDSRLLEKKYTEIKCLDPFLGDSGWVMVRHHPSEVHLNTYIDGLMDFCTSSEDKINEVISDETGFYTIMHRKPLPGTPDCLLVYIFKETVVFTEGGGEEPAELNAYYIFHPNGDVTNEPNLLYPHMEAEMAESY